MVSASYGGRACGGFSDPERVARNYLYTLRHPFEERVPLEDVFAEFGL